MEHFKKGDQHFTDDGRGAKITVDLVLQATAKMSEYKVNGPEDAVASEMIKSLSLKNIYIFTRYFQKKKKKRFTGELEAPIKWKIVKLLFLSKQDAEPKKGTRSHRAIALTSVMSKWYASSIILRLKKTCRRKKLHMGRVAGTSCQHLQVMMTSLPQKHWRMAGGNDSHVEAWQCGAPNNVLGKPGRQYGVR